MQQIVLVCVSLAIAVGLIVFLNYLLKAPLTVPVGDSTSIYMRLSPVDQERRWVPVPGQGQLELEAEPKGQRDSACQGCEHERGFQRAAKAAGGTTDSAAAGINGGGTSSH